MNSFVQNIPFGSVPREVQGALAQLLEKAGKGVFLGCRILSHQNEEQSEEDRVAIEPWRGDDLQFCVYYRKKSWKGVLDAAKTVPQEEKNALYLLLQAGGDFAFKDKSTKKYARAHPDHSKKPEQQPHLSKTVAESASAQQSVAPTVISSGKSPKDSLPDVCKKILAAIGEADTVPRETLSGIIAAFFAPASPKGTVGPILSLLAKRKIVAPQYDQTQKPNAENYLRPVGYAIDISALRACAEAEIIVPPKKEKMPRGPRMLNHDDESLISRFQNDLERVTASLQSVEAVILKTEQELALLQKRKSALVDARECLCKVAEAFKKLDA